MLDVVTKVLKQNNIFSSKFLELLPGGFFIATDAACETVIHNPQSAKFHRLQAWKIFSFSLSAPPQFKVYHKGRLLKLEEMPIYRAACFGEEITGEENELMWPDGISKVGIFNASPIRNDQGEIKGSICTLEEVTQFVHLKKELDVHRLNLQRMIEENTQKLKSKFEKREHLERDVARLERLNLIGQLAAGLGHEVRNPMTTIRGLLQLLQNKPEQLKYQSYFDLMIEELDRTNSIITDFLSLAKNKPTELKRQCLNKLLMNLFPLLQADAYSQGKKCIFEAGEIVESDLDTNEITQLVLNLARNGLDAMPKNGCLFIETYMQGQTTVLSIRDEGTGIPPENIPKIKIPFFTTKENGTGLGIPMCYRIAEKHNASIEVKTGQTGTTFLVCFPPAVEAP